MHGPSSTRQKPSRFRPSRPAISNLLARTLGIRTDVVLNAPRLEIEERGAFAILRTPSNPGYYFGNYLIFDRAPAPVDLERWQDEFERAFEHYPQVRHAAYVFSGRAERDAVKVFADAGYTIENRAVMTAARIADFQPPAGIEVRPLLDDADWAGQMDMQMASRPPEHDERAYRRFKERQIAHHRALSERSGVWLGAFDGARLTGSCGIFPAGDALARYQDVSVDPGYRNRGIARALVSAAGAWALRSFGVRTLIIVAKADAFARRIYEKAGFEMTQSETAIWKARR